MKYSQSGIANIYRCITCSSIMKGWESKELECYDCKKKFNDEMRLRSKSRFNIEGKTRKKTESLKKRLMDKKISNNYYKKSKLDGLRLEFALVEKSALSKERTAKMILLNAKIMREENINNKK
jgi:hypothetical protein